MKTLKTILPFLFSISAIVLILLTFQHTSLFQDLKTSKQLDQPLKLKKILGRYEGCLHCHDKMTGFSKSHNPNALGCSSCHQGNPFSLDKEKAHQGILLVPGNLDNAKNTCGSSQCHSDISQRIHLSLMSTARGMVTVNRFVFGETESPDGPGHITKINYSDADINLRNLCASCHLNYKKLKPAPISHRSRGGGCTACHVHYNSQAKKELQRYTLAKKNNKENIKPPAAHPELTINISDDHCFGCHSRSGRISLNYQGWHETLFRLDPKLKEPLHLKDGRIIIPEIPTDKTYRHLKDGRIVQFETEDIHHQKKLSCIDCHTSRETMGDNVNHNHQEEQVEISCIDCHFIDPPNTIDKKELDEESNKIIQLRKWDKIKGKWIIAKKSGKPLVNVILKPSGRYIMKSKSSGVEYPLKKTIESCSGTNLNHKRLDCQSCHSSWSPQCINCHIAFDPNKSGVDHLKRSRRKGKWIEYRSLFLADPPVLGIKKVKISPEKETDKVSTFSPGMILTIDKDKTQSNHNLKKFDIFKRLYAPSFSHTITKKARECNSCHNSSLALGYGRGELNYLINKNIGQWEWIPKLKNHFADNLPLDAWIPFLKERFKNISTRTTARPFNLIEQKRILTVGACLTCHPSTWDKLDTIYLSYKQSIKRLSPQCILPEFR